MSYSVLPLLPIESSKASVSTTLNTAGTVAKAATVMVENVSGGAPPKDIDSFKSMETVALVVDEPKADFKLTPIILDEVRDDEVLVDMKYSGICTFNPRSCHKMPPHSEHDISGRD